MSTISASTTSTTAYKVTADTTGTLVLQTGATPTTAVTVGTDQSVTFAQAANLPNTFGFKNRIINGGCNVSQYGAVSIAAPTAKVYGGCDRIAVGAIGFTTVSGTISQAGSAGGGVSATGFVQQLQVTTTGSGVISFSQRIEANNVGDLNGKAITVTVSLYQDTGSTLNPTINIYKANALNDFSSNTFVSGQSVSLPSGTRTTFTWTTTLGASDATNGIALVVNLPVGAVTSKYFQIGDVQLEKGSTATSFDYRPYGTELALCQRYCVKDQFRVQQYNGDASSGYRFQCNLPVSQRNTSQSITVSGTTVSGFATPTAETWTTTAIVFVASSTASGANKFFTLAYLSENEL